MDSGHGMFPVREQRLAVISPEDHEIFLSMRERGELHPPSKASSSRQEDKRQVALDIGGEVLTDHVLSVPAEASL